MIQKHIDAGVFSWFKRVHEGPFREVNTSLKCWVQACLIFSSNISS